MSMQTSSMLVSLLLLASFDAISAFVPQQQGQHPLRRHNAFIRPSSNAALYMTPPEGETSRRHVEFLNVEPPEEHSSALSDRRKQRLERDERIEQQFAQYGNDLWDLRTNMERLSDKLIESLQEGTMPDDGLRSNLYQLEQRDPELVYKMELEGAMQAESEGRMEDALRHKEVAMAARSCLPQFNLEGLWVGKYGRHGYEMINVTYVGDLMVAKKVTGDKNVPLGEITFQADLSPLSRPPPIPISLLNENDKNGDRQAASLQPITLTDKAAKKWGTKQLPRFNGLGQVAEEGFTNNQWMEGQLILIGQEYFSFAWVPIEHQIFFGRPSPELALKMLRKGGTASLKDKTWFEAPPAMDDELDVLKQYATHCLEVTSATIDEDLQGDEYACIWRGIDAEESYFQ